MRRLLILSFLFCLLSLTESVNAAPNTITKTELDLKLELQKKDIDANKVQTAETKAFIKEELDNQKEYNIDSRKYISDKADIINWWLAAIGIVVTLIGVFSAWRVVVTENDVKDKIKEIDKTAEENKKKMQKDLEAVSVIKKEIEEIKLEVNECLTKIKGNADKSDELVNGLRENYKKQSPDSIDKKENQEDKDITNYVVYVNKSKPESELTANDWLLKGYDAYQNNDFESSCYYYKRSSQLGGNSADLFNFWGIALSNLAKLKDDAALYNAAISKYEKVIEIDSNYKQAYINWSNSLMQLSVLQGTFEQNKQRIEELLLKAESLKKGAGSYNLACLYSLLNEKEKAFEWLDKNLNNKEYKQSRAFIENDKDFDTIKEDPRFVALLNRYYPQ